MIPLGRNPGTVAALKARLPGGEDPSKVRLVRGQFFVEVLNPSATKELALLALLGCKDLRSVVAFGDADNDVEMLSGVGPSTLCNLETHPQLSSRSLANTRAVLYMRLESKSFY